MGNRTLSRNTLNQNVGLYINMSRRAALDTDIGHICNWIKCGTAGTVIYQDVRGGGTPEIWVLEAGETAPLIFDKILSAATIDGVPETTTATGLLWGVSAAEISNITS